MSRARWLAALALGAVLGAVGVEAWQQLRRPSSIHSDPAFRAARAAGARLGPAEWASVTERDQRAGEALGLSDEQAVREWIGSRMTTIEPSDDELRRLYDEHRETFGERTFQASRDVLARLARLRQVRTELERAGR